MHKRVTKEGKNALRLFDVVRIRFKNTTTCLKGRCAMNDEKCFETESTISDKQKRCSNQFTNEVVFSAESFLISNRKLQKTVPSLTLW
jgi:hypothetical protein